MKNLGKLMGQVVKTALKPRWRAVKRFCRRVVRLPRPLEAFEAPPDPEVTAKPLQLPAALRPSKMDVGALETLGESHENQ